LRFASLKSVSLRSAPLRSTPPKSNPPRSALLRSGKDLGFLILNLFHNCGSLPNQGEMLCVCHEQEQLGAVESWAELEQFAFKSESTKLPQSTFPRPLRELDLTNHRRFNPNAPLHFGGGQLWIQSATACRQVEKWTSFDRDLIRFNWSRSLLWRER
jgi:hypothetical protein